jgi:hypothetical protein
MQRSTKSVQPIRQGEELVSPSYALPEYVERERHPDHDERAAYGRTQLAQALAAVSSGSRLLLAAVASALLVSANQLVESWVAGSPLSTWFVLWLISFAALALLAGPCRRAAAWLRAALKARRARRLQAEHDMHCWESALSDPRVMAEIRRALGPSAPVVHDVVRENWWPLIYIANL